MTPITGPIPAPGNPPTGESVPPDVTAPTVAIPITKPTITKPTIAKPGANEPGSNEPGVGETGVDETDLDAAEAEPKPVPLGELLKPELPEGFPTETLLAGHDAEAAALRQDVDRLRRQLDERPPPLRRPTRKRRSTPLLGALVVGGTIGVIATATLVPWSHLDLPGRDSHSDSATVSTGQNRGGVVGQPVARPGTTPALAPLTAPAGSLPATGPGVTAPGTILVVQIGNDGELNVTENAVLGPRGLRQIRLSLPPLSPLGGEVAALNPKVDNLRVSVNGTAVNATPLADGSGWTVVAGAERARTVRLSYRVTGAIVRSQPSDAGRALGVLQPLLGQTLREQGLPLVARITGGQTGGVTCPGAPSAQSLCAMQDSKGWMATVPAAASSPALLLQLNLKN